MVDLSLHRVRQLEARFVDSVGNGMLILTAQSWTRSNDGYVSEDLSFFVQNNPYEPETTERFRRYAQAISNVNADMEREREELQAQVTEELRTQGYPLSVQPPSRHEEIEAEEAAQRLDRAIVRAREAMQLDPFAGFREAVGGLLATGRKHA